MNLEDIVLEISQIEKDKYCMLSLIYGPLKNRVELIETEQNGSARSWGHWGNREMLVKGYKFQGIPWQFSGGLHNSTSEGMGLIPGPEMII